ncbi:hypothetical protein FF38_04441 [Lucilia cuprina]|uniref:Uncharacterized protein n=1 Tax=Lucilia cuprina TaxID=7375 RepID=A0A0L0C707_LUCCU|nr:hypothetical protein CVS40_12917 [Lucilia cuprina]KNC28055.1 hypothetical protein FF38_04441 [Lucilia cuprina]
MIFQKYNFHIVVFVAFILQTNGDINSSSAIRPTILLGAPAHVISGEHISLDFYAAVELSDGAKNDLQELLYNFLENLQRNLSTSSILNTVVAKPIDIEINRYQLGKLNDLADFFQHSSNTAGQFAQKAEHFFETSKNESHSLLLKLRQLPSAQRFLPTAVKMRLTDYFAEMEFFHVMFSEIIDEALEYIVDTLRSIQRTFLRYADIQRDTLRTWNFKSDEWCCNTYLDFLQQWSAHIFKCAASSNLHVAYDVYATTETSTKYIMRQLEFRIQRLYNCFIFGNYELRCQFLRKPEIDFEKLFAKLDELQQYFDIKIKGGRVTNDRSGRRRRQQDETKNIYDKCIPYGFPDIQMTTSLKTCFYFPNSNKV